MAQTPQPVPGSQILAAPEPEPRSRLGPNEFQFSHLEHTHILELRPLTEQQAEQLTKWDADQQHKILSQVVTSRRTWPPRGEGLNLAEQNLVVTELLRRHAEARTAEFNKAAAAAQPAAPAEKAS